MTGCHSGELRHDLAERASRTAEFVAQNYQLLAELSGAVSYGGIQPGQTDVVTWQQTDCRGKQQPVNIVNFRTVGQEGPTSEEEFTLVFRPTRGVLHQCYRHYEVVRKYYPRPHLETMTPRNGRVLVMDFVNGPEIQNDPEGYRRLIADPAMFDKLCDESFGMIDEILCEPLGLSDIEPSRGQNVIYNTDTNRFQLFDVDTLSRSNAPYVEKFLDIIDPRQQVDDVRLRFIMRMVQKYEAKYPDLPLQFGERQTAYGDFVEVTDQTVVTEEDTLIYPDHPDYEMLYSGIHWCGTRGKKDLPPLKLEADTGVSYSRIDSEMLEAIRQNDLDTFRDLMDQRSGRMVVDVFKGQKGTSIMIHDKNRR